jgi:single-strand DNA-binding protein
MANDINNVVLVGRLTRESELKFLNNGTAVCRFSLAVNRMKRSGDQWEEEVSYFDIVLWGKQAETLNPYLVKGRQICVSGELRQSRWEQDGQSRSRIEVVANNVQLIGSSAGQNNSAGSNGPSAQSSGQRYDSGTSKRQNTVEPRRESRPQSQMADFPGPEQFDDDIPF